jgi:hypothetical protein
MRKNVHNLKVEDTFDDLAGKWREIGWGGFLL